MGCIQISRADENTEGSTMSGRFICTFDRFFLFFSSFFFFLFYWIVPALIVLLFSFFFCFFFFFTIFHNGNRNRLNRMALFSLFAFSKCTIMLSWFIEPCEKNTISVRKSVIKQFLPLVHLFLPFVHSISWKNRSHWIIIEIVK